MNVVIYARYSSHSQTEQSIEGQLQTCYEYARNNGYIVIGEYIDRAQSGTSDSRMEFQRMISDSDKHTFEGVLVYQLDRFARNRYDSAINKAKLKKNGVRVISARENISDDASGILVEGVLESMAEYYSAELSQKIRRGMDINAEKCLSNGSNPGLGYRVDEERRFHIDPEGAAVVREIFEQYASGKTVTEIIQSLNARQIKTSQGKAFNKNSLHRLLRNRRYIGYYIYKGVETPNGMPRILEDELFERVQHILDRNKKAPARARGREEYLLTTKLFCGYCREMMTGYGGTGKSGKAYHYYACNNFKRRKCKKKVISKEKIENRVVLECRKLLTDSNIEHIAASVAAVCESDRDTVSIKRIKAAIQEADTAIENLWKALEKGQAADMITERIEKRQKEKEELQAQLAIEMNKQVRLSAADIRAYLYALKYGDKNDENTKRGIINIFLRAVYLFDETFTLILNGSDKPIVIDDILLDEIEEGLDDDLTNHNLCSPLVADAPPRRCGRHIVRSDFFTKVTSHSFCRSSSPNRTRFTGLAVGFTVTITGIIFVNISQKRAMRPPEVSLTPVRIKRSFALQRRACSRCYDVSGTPLLHAVLPRPGASFAAQGHFSSLCSGFMLQWVRGEFMWTNMLIGILIPFAGTALGAGAVFLLRGAIRPWVQKLLLGFASGVMIAASVWSLLIPAIDMAQGQGGTAGVAFLLILDSVVPHQHLDCDKPEGCPVSLGKSTMLFLAVTLHNLPEGMAVGVVFAGAMQGEAGLSLASAFALSAGIALQNIPEGAVISMPLASEGARRGRSFALGVASGAVEPIGALLTIALTSVITPILPYILSFAAGAMIYVVVEELIPESQAGEHSNIGTIGAAAGFVIMMILDVALG